MEILLVALVPIAGIAIMVATALITAPPAVRSAMVGQGEASPQETPSHGSAA
jgi:hypothetical protein